ncbi:MAG: FAD-dependent oxidoreductase [Desulfobacterales bacterium]|jgi:NADPH-dependent 2,4-dienoyl-CoA reductase/sulfur reductase-like enzyme
MRFVVIGGDAAGMSAASRAKRHNAELEVTVLEQTADVSYSACGMPYNIADPERSVEDLVVRRAEVFRSKQGIDLRTGHRAEKIDPGARTVAGTDAEGRPFEISYDRLLIATGASPLFPDVPGIDSDGVVALKQLQDARVIKDLLAARPVKKVAVLGMGYIALEMVEALHQRGIAVDMVKPRHRLLPWLDEALSSEVREEVESHGVGIHDGHAIERIETAGNRLSVVCKGLTLETDLVLSAVGVRPNSRIAAEAGLALGPDDAVAVDRRLATSDSNILSAGDCADAFHVVSGKRVWIPLALRANRAGWAAADNVCGKPTEIEGVAGTAVFKVFDLQVGRSGLTVAEAARAGFDPAAVTVETRSRAHAHPGSTKVHVQLVGDRQSGRLLGAFMVCREGIHRINAAAVALHANMTAAQFAATDLAYAPPFGPVWDPMLTAANQLVKKL